MTYDWNFSRLAPYVEAFAAGTLTTVLLAIVINVLGTALGVAGGLALRGRGMRVVLQPLVDVLRAVPPLVLILYFYYLLTAQVVGVTVGAFWVTVIALSLNLAAFTAELVRAAVGNVEARSLDAARALGMTPGQSLSHVVLPGVFREVLPGMTALYIGVLKLTSLASVINVREVVYAAQTVIADVSRSLEAWTVVALVYVLLVVPATYLARWVERWSRRGAPQEGRA